MAEVRENNEVTSDGKLARLIEDPFQSVIAAVVLCSTATAVVYLGINTLGTLV